MIRSSTRRLLSWRRLSSGGFRRRKQKSSSACRRRQSPIITASPCPPSERARRPSRARHLNYQFVFECGKRLATQFIGLDTPELVSGRLNYSAHRRKSTAVAACVLAAAVAPVCAIEVANCAPQSTGTIRQASASEPWERSACSIFDRIELSQVQLNAPDDAVTFAKLTSPALPEPTMR